MTNSKTTSSRVASIAGRILRRKNASRLSKTLAASALAQCPEQRKILHLRSERRRRLRNLNSCKISSQRVGSIAGRILRRRNSSQLRKILAASILAQCPQGKKVLYSRPRGVTF